MSSNGKPEPPDGLSALARTLWDAICEESAIDAAAAKILETYCQAFDRRQDARAAITAEGAVIKDRFGVQKISPWVAIERDSTLIMHRAFRLLGFDQEPRGAQGELFK